MCRRSRFSYNAPRDPRRHFRDSVKRIQYAVEQRRAETVSVIASHKATRRVRSPRCTRCSCDVSTSSVRPPSRESSSRRWNGLMWIAPRRLHCDVAAALLFAGFVIPRRKLARQSNHRLATRLQVTRNHCSLQHANDLCEVCCSPALHSAQLQCIASRPLPLSSATDSPRDLRQRTRRDRKRAEAVRASARASTAAPRCCARLPRYASDTRAPKATRAAHIGRPSLTSAPETSSRERAPAPPSPASTRSTRRARRPPPRSIPAAPLLVARARCARRPPHSITGRSNTSTHCSSLAGSSTQFARYSVLLVAAEAAKKP